MSYCVKLDDKTLYEPLLQSEGYIISDPLVTKATNKAGSFTFKIPPTNPLYSELKKLKSIISVYKDGNIFWKGRVLDERKDFNKIKEVTCEGELAFLNDVIVAPYDYSETGMTINEFFQYVMELYAANCSEYRKIQPGYVYNVDSDTRIYPVSNTYENVLSVLSSKLIDVVGGILVFRYQNGVSYLDYYGHISDTIKQKIEFGKNLINLEEYVDATDVYTYLIPLGKQDDEGNYLDITSVNNGLNYIYSATGENLYGKITKSIEYTDIDDPTLLKQKAEAVLADAIKEATTITIKAIDLQALGVDTDAIDVNCLVNVVSPPHEIDSNFMCSEITFSLSSIANDEYTFGADVSSLTEMEVESSSATRLDTEIQNTSSYWNIRKQLKYAIQSADGKTTNYYSPEPPYNKDGKVGDTWFDTDNDNKMYTWDGKEWVSMQFGFNAIADKAIQTTKIGDQAVTWDQIKDLAITSDKLAEAAVTAEKIKNEVIAAEKLVDGCVTADKIKDKAVNGEKIAAAAIDTAHIKDAAIDNAKIANGAITNAKIENGAINSAKIEKAAIDTACIAEAAITSALIKNGAIENVHIQNGAITSAKIENGSITNAHIQNAAIENAHIKDGAIDNAKIANLDAGKITTGTLNAARVAIGDMTNFATVTATDANSMVNISGGTKIVTIDNFLAITSATGNRYIMLCDTTANSFLSGDKIHAYSKVYVSSERTVCMGIWFYDKSGTYVTYRGVKYVADAGWNDFVNNITLNDLPSNVVYFVVGFDFYDTSGTYAVYNPVFKQVATSLIIGDACFIDSDGAFLLGPLQSKGSDPLNYDLVIRKAAWIRYGLELLGSNEAGTAYIDFHYGEKDYNGINPVSDYTARLCEESRGIITARNSIVSSSDARLKENIVDIPDVYMKLVERLQPKLFNFIGSDYKTIGLIAQEVLEIEKDLGITDSVLIRGSGEGDNYYSLDYSALNVLVLAYLLRKGGIENGNTRSN